jgi:hypothetical protein
MLHKRKNLSRKLGKGGFGKTEIAGDVLLLNDLHKSCWLVSNAAI